MLEQKIEVLTSAVERLINEISNLKILKEPQIDSTEQFSSSHVSCAPDDLVLREKPEIVTISAAKLMELDVTPFKAVEVISLDEFKTKLLELSKTIGKDGVKKLLEKYGATKVSDIPEAKRQEILNG